MPGGGPKESEYKALSLITYRMPETLEEFMTYVDVVGECWLAKGSKRMTGPHWKSMRQIRTFPTLGESHMHRIAFALMQPEKYKKMASITPVCKTPFCCNGLHYQYGVLNECYPRAQNRF
jgi:hypothetical protein